MARRGIAVMVRRSPANEIDSRYNYRFAPRRNVGDKMHSSTCFFLDRVQPTR